MVSNAGTISIGRGGYAALIGGQVRNSGLIAVPMGKVGLGSGEAVTLDVSGDGFLQVAVPTSAGGKGVLIQQSGTISSAGGTVILDAATARAAARNAVNISGTIDAHSISGHSGSIQIGGGAGGIVQMSGRLTVSGSRHYAGGSVAISGHRIKVSGTIEASGRVGGRVTLAAADGMTLTGRIKAIGHHGKGGTVTVTGLHIVLQGAKVDASGTSGGGTVLVGGNAHGAGPLPNAGTVTIDAKSTITADAIGTGDGGQVVVWSRLTTNFAGAISAKGGQLGGDGGQAEVSSHGVLAYTGSTVLTAAQGATGTLLLDPYNVTISSGVDSNTSSASSGSTTTYTPSGTSVISNTELQTQLASANVTITTGAAGSGSDAGNITVAAPVTWSSGYLLTLTAANAIAIDAPITITGAGKLALNYNTSALANLSFGRGASVSYATGSGSGITGQALSINGTSYNLIYSQAQLNGIDPSGNGTGAAAYGLGLAGNYALATPLTLTGTYAQAVIGESSQYTGTFNGLGNTISNLTISTSANYAGLFGQLGGTIENVGLVGGSVSGGVDGGGLVGYQAGGTITNTYATGAVSGGTFNGGLVGFQNNGTITSSYATGAVSGGNFDGGLVGYQAGGMIISSYATGAVSGGLYGGGLVGDQAGGMITSSYATGAVSGGTYDGGLAGQSSDTITSSYATGAVSGGTNHGGLVGYQFSGTITSSYWDTQTSGQSQSVGYLKTGSQTAVTGYTTAQLQGLAPISGSTYFSTATQLGSATVWGGGMNGLYPYLTSFFPNGVQAVSGRAYSDGGMTPLAWGAAGANSVSVIANGASFGSATTGANGYYYVFGPAGSFTTANNVLAYTSANAQTGATNAATLATATAAANQQGVNIYGNAVTVPTTATSLLYYLNGNGGTLATAQAAAQQAALGADGNSTAAATAINGTAGLGLVTTGTGFAVDTPVTTASTFVVATTGSGAPLTVSQPILVANGGALGLSAAGALEIDANITVPVTGTVALAYDQNTTTGAVTDLSFAQGTSLSFTGINNTTGNPLGGLTINGQAYTLLNALAGSGSTGPDTGTNDIAGIDHAGDSGHYALATNVSGTGSAASAQFNNALAGSGTNTFSGTFEGLGHTITDFTISSSADAIGLVGISSGTIRDIGLVGGAVSGPSAESSVGGLVGAQTAGTIQSSYATDAVSGDNAHELIGGLVGSQAGGTIQSSYATGAVSGVSNDHAGGLVGQGGGTIQSSYATGAVSVVSGNSAAGGLVGYLTGGTIQSSFAAGAVSVSFSGFAGAGFGGLVGYAAGTIQSSVYDVQTTGQSVGVGSGSQSGVTGYTTAQLQGLAPLPGVGGHNNPLYFSAATQLGAAFAGGTGGLYPYLASFYPTTPQAISGIAYSDRGITPLASGSAGPNSVVVDIAGTQTSVSTGANGYYYVLEPAGTLATPGTATLAYTTADNTASGSVTGASLIAATGTTQHLDIWGSTLIASTTDTSLSGVIADGLTTGAALYNSNGNAALATSAAGTNVVTGLNTLTSAGYIATGTAGFTVDVAVASGAAAGGLYVQTTQGPIIVSTAQTIGGTAGATNLSLYSSGALAFNQSVTVEGAGSVNLAFNSTDPTNLSFAQGAALTYTDANGNAVASPVTGQALAINGASYTLLYSLAAGTTGQPDTGTSDIAGIDANTAAGGDNGAYALATNLTGTGTANAAQFSATLVGGTGLNFFSGTLEGLGHTISNLTINASGSSNLYVGLIGKLVGTVRDIGLLGGGVSATGANSNSYLDAYVGDLAGVNFGTIVRAYSTGTASATISGSASTFFADAGGLVGFNMGTIIQAYATGAVSGSASGGSYNEADVGGLAGYNSASSSDPVPGFYGTITQSYATGAGSSKTSGGGGAFFGGLVGTIAGGAITQSYATGAGSARSSSLTYIGGLIGFEFSGTIASSFWDTTTSGQRTLDVGSGSQSGATGYTTAQLQGLAPGFSVSTLGAAFAGGTGGLYPYLASFYPTTPQAISGIAYSDRGITPLASGSAGPNSVVVDIAGTQTSVSTGANGYYYVLEPAGTLATPGTATLAYTTADNTASGSVTGASLIAATGTTQHLDIWGSTLIASTTDTSLSGVIADGLTTGAALYNSNGNAALATSAAGTNVVTGLNTLTSAGYIATGTAGFTVDVAVASGAAAGGLYVQTTQGPIIVSTAQTIGGTAGATNLSLYSSGALAFNQSVTVEGAGSVNLAFNSTDPTNLSFAQGAALTYTDANGNAVASPVTGQALAINGASYTLLYSLAAGTTGQPDTGTSDIAGIDANTAAGGDNGAYALATSLTGTGTANAAQFSAALAGSGTNAFSGTLEGLGHTISNLTISDSTIAFAGLFGKSTGAIRDIGIVGGYISGSGYAADGGLVGVNTGTITNVYATDAVSGGERSSVGGLVGDNDGAITNAYATGTVSGGGFAMGGLVGVLSQGSITNAYATGAVSGSSSELGGLVGLGYLSSVTNAYATGAVSSGSGPGEVGGLVGRSNQLSLTNVYATGAVSGGGGSAKLGGLVGNDLSATITTNAYFDLQTTGQSAGIGAGGGGPVVGLTTAQFQSNFSGYMSDLGAAFGGGANGLYPYLASFYVTTPQAISGIAYADRGITPLASGSAGPNSVFVDSAGTQTSATTGANGYYYVLEPAGTLAAPGTATLAYTTVDNTAAGPVTGASLITATGTTQHLDIWGATLIAPTTDTSLSGVIADGLTTGTALYNSNGNAALAASATGTNVANGLGTLADAGYVATGASGFTVNAAIASGAASGGLYVQTTQGSISVTTAQTFNGPTNLTLSSAGAVTIDETVHVGGAGSVNLAGTSQPGLTTTGLSFNNGASIDYGATDQGGTFALNGSSYTLLYAASGLQTVNANLAGNYALATNLDASGLTGLTTGVIAGGVSTLSATRTTPFSGDLDGLGHVIANLTINGGVNNLVGLIGDSAGTVSDLTLVGGAVFGHVGVGGLVGDNSGVVQTSSANLTVSGTTDPSLQGVYRSEAPSADTGGLVGSNDGLIQSSHATGDVSGSSGGSTGVGGLVGAGNGSVQTSYATGAVSGARDVGGLIGYISGSTVETSYATGAVSGTDSYIGGLVGDAQNSLIQTSYATGAVSGGSYVGGLAGIIDGAVLTATITNSYATGAVSGGSAVGGFVGIVNAYAGGTAVLSNVYAAGAVAGGGNVGGLIGETQLVGGGTSSVTDAYYDAATTGQAVGLQSDGSFGLSTAALQSTATTGVSLGAAFAGGAAGGENNVYPYLTYFDPHGVQAVSGLAYTNAGTTLLASPASGTSGNGLPTNQHPGLVSVAVNGVALGTATTGANGYYYIFVPAGTLPANTRTTAYTVADTGTNGSGAQNAATYVTASGANTVPGTNVYGGWQFDASGSSFTTLSSLNTADAAAAGGLAPTGVALANREIVTTAPSFALNAITSLAGTFVLDATGNVTQSAAITANTLLLDGGGNFALTGSTTIATLAASGGTIDVDTTGAMTVGTAGDATGTSDAGIDATGSVTLISRGAQTLAAHGTITSGGAILLAGNGIFTNAAGAKALMPGHAASFTIYSQDPTHPTTVLPADAFGGLAATNYYNDAYNFTTKAFASAVPTGNHFVYGYAATLTPLLSGSATKTYNGTTVASLTNLTIGATLLSGSDVATFSFTGANYDTANAGSNKTVTATGITLVANPNNYALGSLSASAAVGSIGKATITVVGATGIDKIYDTTTALVNGAVGFTDTGVLGHDQVFVTAGSDAYAGANAGAKGINVSGLTLSGSAAANYQLSATSVIGSGTIGKATITVAGATGIDKIYDTTTALLNGAVGFTDTGVLGHDQVTVTAGSDVYASANAGVEAINVSGLTLSGSAAANYQLSSMSVTGSGTIGKATITVAGATGIDKTYDTTTALVNGAGGFMDTGVLGHDQVTVNAGSDAYASANAGTESINVSGLTLSGAAAANYQLSATSVIGSGTIGKATITVAGATGIDKTYDTTTALTNGAVGFTDTGVLGHDQVIVTAGSDAYASANAGSEAINVSGLTLSGAAAANYQLSATSVIGSGTIGKATITVAGATGIDKTYDTTTALTNGAIGFTDTGVLGHDQVIVTAGSDAYASANAGAEGINVSGLTLSGSAAANYQLSATSVTGSGTIGKATITVAGATGIDKTYDTTTALLNGALGFTDTGVLGHDQVIVTAGSDAYASANAGAEGINVSGLTLSGSAAANYQLSATSVTGSGTIGKATITVAGATGIDKTYDTTTALLNGAVGFTDTGILGHDQVTVTASSDAYASANAGAEGINVSGLTLSGSAAANYQLSATSATGSGTIGKATITVAGATGIDKTYDTTTALLNGAVGFTDTGVLGHDQVFITAGSDAYASANAGAEGINVSGLTLSGSAAANYQLSATSVTGSGKIGKATITVAGATGIDKTYDTTTALVNGAVGFTDTGVLGHDQVIVMAGSDVYASANAGAESINVAGLTMSGAAAANYQLSATSVTGSGTIGKATITVAGATGIDKTYDTTTALLNGALGFTDTGVLGHDQVIVMAGSDVYASANAGAEGINVSGLTLSGAAAANYQLSATSVTGSGTIGKATITVAGATGIDKTYDATTALLNSASGFTDTGVLGHDQVIVTAGSDVYASANAGAEAINVAGLTLSGGAAANYQLSATSVTGSGTIGKATIIVTANSGHSIYGDTPTNPGLSVTGLQGGQGVDVLTGLSNSFGIDGRTDVGAYTLSVAGMLTNANYVIGATRTGTFDVTLRSLTITADSSSRLSGFANPPLAYQIGGLVNGDGLTGALTTAATITSAPGRYAIAQGTLAASANYSVTYVPGTLTVDASVSQAASTLASTVDRALVQWLGHPIDAPPFLVAADEDGTDVFEIVRQLGDPRFDQTIACVKDVCTIVVKRKPIKTTSLEPRP